MIAVDRDDTYTGLLRGRGGRSSEKQTLVRQVSSENPVVSKTSPPVSAIRVVRVIFFFSIYHRSFYTVYDGDYNTRPSPCSFPNRN